MMVLTVQRGPQAGIQFPVDRPSVRLGRGSANDIVLEDSQASRSHAEISQQGDQFYIRDLGSVNGTLVNNERISGPRVLRPGDQVQIGNTILSCDATMAFPASAAVAPARGEGPETDWEREYYVPEDGPAAEDSRQRYLIWGLVAIVAVLAVAVALVLFQALRTRPGGPEPTVAVAGPAALTASTAPIELAATPTPQPPAHSAATAIVDIDAPTVELQPTVEVKAPAPPPVQPTQAPAAGAPALGALPAGGLEQLPVMVATAFPGVPPDQLPQAIAAQMQTLTPQQAQGMIGSLFPGVIPARLPQVVAASFPGLSEQDTQALLNLVFPGQGIALPELGPVEGRMALGIYDKDREEYDLYLADAADGQVSLLIEEAGDPDFSPDGQRLVYHSWGADTAGLRVVNTDGNDDQPLTAVDKDGYPSFAPDGERISFFNDDLKSLHVINRDGTGRRDIGSGEYPAWSPAGDQIVYRGCVSGGRCGVVVANADGSNPRQITTHANDAAPRWSPNGGQIAFMSDRDGNWEIYVINSDGSWLRRITLNAATDTMPVWSSSGLRIAFRSDRGGQGAIWVTSGIGGGAFKMFDAESGPEWTWTRMDWVE